MNQKPFKLVDFRQSYYKIQLHKSTLKKHSAVVQALVKYSTYAQNTYKTFEMSKNKLLPEITNSINIEVSGVIRKQVAEMAHQ